MPQDAQDGPPAEPSIEEWHNLVGRHVEARRINIGYPSIRAAAAASGEWKISEGAWRPVESGRRITKDGERVARPSVRTQMGLAWVLRWPQDFVHLLLDGESPDRLHYLATFDAEGSKARHPAQEDVVAHEAKAAISLLQADLHEVFERLVVIEQRLAVDAITERAAGVASVVDPDAAGQPSPRGPRRKPRGDGSADPAR